MTANTSKYPNTFYRVSLKAVIRNSEGQVLVNKEGDSDTWSLPGGGWDHGETEYEALARELHEEVGYVGTFTSSPLGTAVFWIETYQVWLLWVVYDVTTENLDFSIGEDSTEIGFVDPGSLGGSTSMSEQWIYNNLS